MASVYDRVNGEKLERLMGRAQKTQAALDKQALRIALKAEARLASHHQTGNAQIGISFGDIDRYVEMFDPPAASSPGAAMSIEYGHYLGKRGTADREFVEGLWILHDAAGLARKGK